MFGTGTLSGMMGGFFGMQGPPVVLYFLSSTKSKEEYMALVQPYILCGNIIMTVARGYNGFLTPTVGIDYCYGIGGVLIGVLLGSYVFKYIPTRISSMSSMPISAYRESSSSLNRPTKETGHRPNATTQRKKEMPDAAIYLNINAIFKERNEEISVIRLSVRFFILHTQPLTANGLP